MSTIFSVDHHATFQGWSADYTENKAKTSEWSSRRSVGFILISALASWVLVLSPILVGLTLAANTKYFLAGLASGKCLINALTLLFTAGLF